MSQSGKIALVTGGAQGIGRTFAESLLAEGASVAILDLNKEAGEETIKELSEKYRGKIIFLECDVTNHQQLEECFKFTKEKFSGLDLVINNAGIGNEKESGWMKVVDINLVAVIKGSKLGMKYMGIDNGGRGGTVVNISSITSLEPFPSIAVYSATKAAINQFSRSYGQDLYFFKSGVKILAINPGMTKTMFCTDAARAFPSQCYIDNFFAHFNTFPLQSVENMGKGLIEVLQKGQNGSVWTIENDEPAKLTIIK